MKLFNKDINDRFIFIGLTLFPALVILFEFIFGTIAINPIFMGTTGIVLASMAGIVALIEQQNRNPHPKVWPLLLKYFYFFFESEDLLVEEFFWLGFKLSSESFGYDKIYIDCSDETKGLFNRLAAGYSLNFGGLEVKTFTGDFPSGKDAIILTNRPANSNTVLYNSEQGNYHIVKV